MSSKQLFYIFIFIIFILLLIIYPYIFIILIIIFISILYIARMIWVCEEVSTPVIPTTVWLFWICDKLSEFFIFFITFLLFASFYIIKNIIKLIIILISIFIISLLIRNLFPYKMPNYQENKKDNSHLNNSKSKILIIHWYAFNKINKNNTIPTIYWDYKWEVKNAIINWEFDIYRWWINNSYIDPFSNIALYKKETLYTTNQELIKDLYKTIEKNNYEIIITHSMWSKLLFNTLEIYQIPKNLKKVITIQSDLKTNNKFKNENIINNIKKWDFKRTNYYNFIDFHLWAWSVLNFEWKNWLSWTKDIYQKNIFHKIKWWFDRHNFPINDYEFIKNLINK